MSPRLQAFLSEHQISAVFLSIVAGLVFPHFFQPLARGSSLLLFAIFFIASLRINLDELRGYAKDFRLLAVSNVLMLGILPLALWISASHFAPEWALPFLIFGSMPTGLTVALIADLFGGRTSLAMLVSVTTSLLAPFTIPLIFQWTIGAQVPIPVGKMFASLALTIIAPFLFAMLTRRAAPRWIAEQESTWKNLSVLLFMLLMAGIVANSAQGQSLRPTGSDFGLMIMTLILLASIGWLAFTLTSWRSRAERFTLALCMIFLNNSLALFVTNTFFRTPETVRAILIMLATMNAAIPFVRWVAKRELSHAEISDIPIAPQNPFSISPPHSKEDHLMRSVF